MEKLMNETGIYINYLEKETPNEDQDATIMMFDKLWSEGFIQGDPVVVAKEMGVPEEYIQSFVEWYVELNDLEYTPWISKYKNPEENTNVEHTVGEYLPDWFEHHDSLSKSDYEEMRIFHENNPQ